jgi:hypothetical protein
MTKIAAALRPASAAPAGGTAEERLKNIAEAAAEAAKNIVVKPFTKRIAGMPEAIVRLPALRVR